VSRSAVIAANRIIFGSLGLAVGVSLGAVAGAVVFPTLASATRSAVTPIAHHARDCDIGFRAWEGIPDDGTRVTFDQNPKFARYTTRDILCMLKRLNAPDALINQLEQEESSGERAAVWKHYAIVWERSNVDGFGATIVATTPRPGWRSPK
jgi:hypothetical protein